MFVFHRVMIAIGSYWGAEGVGPRLVEVYDSSGRLVRKGKAHEHFRSRIPQGNFVRFRLLRGTYTIEVEGGGSGAIEVPRDGSTTVLLM